MNFKTKKVNTKTLGERLADLRGRADLSLDEAAKLANVQRKHLAALEQGQYAALPDNVYVRGFLRSLSEVYRADGGELVRQFEAERGIEQNLKKLRQRGAAAAPVRLPKFVLSPKTITIAGLALLGAVTLGYLFWQVSSLTAAPELVLYSPEADGTVNSSVMLIRGKTEAGSVVTINSQPIVVDAKGGFVENISLARGSNQIAIKSRNRFDKTTEITRSIVFEEREIAGSFTADGAVADAGSPDKLTVEIIIEGGPSWVYLRADGQETYSGTMLPDSRRTVEADSNVVLTSGNAGATRVILGGRDLGLLGREGEVIRDIEFTR